MQVHRASWARDSRRRARSRRGQESIRSPRPAATRCPPPWRRRRSHLRADASIPARGLPPLAAHRARFASPKATTSVTRGRPSVSVPVLSTTSVCKRPACSSAVALRMRMPDCAPRPVPTMIAVGVASPSAHGHAITSTATACTSAVAASPAIHHVAKNVTTAMARTIGTKMPETRSAVRWMGAFDPCACATRRTMPARSVALAGLRRFTRKEPVLVHGARIHGIAGLLRDRARFAGQHALVHCGRAFADDAVDRDALARAHRRQRSPTAMSSTAISTVVPPRMTCAARGASRRSPSHRRRRAGLRARFEELAEQHERDDRRCRLEVHVAFVQAEHGHDGAPCVRHRRAQHDQHVHVGAAAAQRVPRAHVEAPSDPELDGCGERELPPARQPIVWPPDSSMGIICSNSGADRSAATTTSRRQRAKLVLPARVVALAVFLRIAAHRRAVSCTCDRRQQLLGRRLRRVEPDARRLGREVHVRRDAGHPVERLLDARRARGAGHAGEAELDAFGCGSRGSHDPYIYPRRVQFKIPLPGINQKGMRPVITCAYMTQSPMKL